MIKVKLFGNLKVRLGRDELDIDLDRRISVGELAQVIASEYPAFGEIFRSTQVVIAVNQEIVDDRFSVSPGMTVALYPPVSGG